MSSTGDWDQFVEELARRLIPALVQRIYGFHLVRVRMLRAPSEKLIYLYLVLAEPQSFTGIRRGLGLAMRTVDRALRRLRASGCVRQDEVYLYWLEDSRS